MAQKTLVKNVRKVSGLKNDGTPNAYWRRFKKRLDDFESVPLEEWKAEEVLGYLLKRYRDHFQIDFSLSYSGPPTKCGEMYCTRRMMETIGTEKGWILKSYIDWVFDTVIIPQKMRIESLGFFFTPKLCNRFKAVFKDSQRITRTTLLPQSFVDVVEDVGVSAESYGDLAFIKMAFDNDPSREQLGMLFERLESMGFNPAVLDSLED